MKKRWSFRLMLLLMLIGLCGHAEKISFPGLGVSFSGDALAVVSKATLAGQTAQLAAIGVDVDALTYDYAAGDAVLDVFFEGLIHVSLTGIHTEDSLRWQSVLLMPDAEKDALLAAFSMTPYEGAQWINIGRPTIRCSYTLESAGKLQPHAKLITVERGMLYQLTATGNGASLEALEAACESAMGMIEFHPVVDEESYAALAHQESLPDDIADDGAVTPLALVGFTGFTLEDPTEIHIRTLPDTDVLLDTANNTLRGRSDSYGDCYFSLSTKRETTYDYTLRAKGEGRTESQLLFSLERRMDAESTGALYRKNSVAIEQVGYDQVSSLAKGAIISFRGKVLSFENLSGYPCALLYTQNISSGVWKAPIWVRITEPQDIALDGIYTIYGEYTGETTTNTDSNGNTETLPIVVCRIVIE